MLRNGCLGKACTLHLLRLCPFIADVCNKKRMVAIDIGLLDAACFLLGYVGAIANLRAVQPFMTWASACSITRTSCLRAS